MWQCAPKENEYVVIAGKGVAEDTAWMKVAEALQNKHRAALLSYREDPAELLPQLQQIHPRYVAIVEKPETLGRDYVMEMHRLSRKVDNDIYADFLWGIITGYDAAGAMKMVNNSTEPLISRMLSLRFGSYIRPNGSIGMVGWTIIRRECGEKKNLHRIR